AGTLRGEQLVTHQTDPAGVPVDSLLVGELADIAKELYIAITVDRVFRGPVMLCSAAGGVDIEEVAATRPQDIFSEPIEPILGFMPFQARRLIAKLGLDASVARAMSQIMSSMYRLFTENDCTLVEINPLIITGSGEMVARDAKLTLADDATSDPRAQCQQDHVIDFSACAHPELAPTDTVGVVFHNGWTF
ncbi:MAG: hypothetical protein IID32_05975, partial [Planctomycetes bacterium]|nr:hypothetical protein [Planctomycetota bacterium]